MGSAGAAVELERGRDAGRPTSEVAHHSFISGDSDVSPRRKRLRSLTWPLPPRPTRVQLERACRIALMETDHPVSVEMVYERIVRRGSLEFVGYKRPFRVIASALTTLVKRGEARLLIDRIAGWGSSARRRQWCRTNQDIEPKSKSLHSQPKSV
jgi:hypothetical protein